MLPWKRRESAQMKQEGGYYPLEREGAHNDDFHGQESHNIHTSLAHNN